MKIFQTVSKTAYLLSNCKIRQKIATIALSQRHSGKHYV